MKEMKLFLVSPQTCSPLKFGNESCICECNSTFCDFLTIPEIIPEGQFIDILTDKAGRRFLIQTSVVSKEKSNEITVIIDLSVKYQKIIGFGGSFTDSATMNIKNLSKAAQENLMRYFQSHFL